MGAERRQDERFHYQSEIEIEPRGQPAFRSTAVNLSAGGVCFSSARPLSPSDPLHIRFTDAQGRMDFKASVRHATRVITEVDGVETGAVFIVGVQFAEISAEQLGWLERALESLGEES
jgi:c-di-GMP-binding flagellar brake protein YcgR